MILLYYGCDREVGHYLRLSEGGRSTWCPEDLIWKDKVEITVERAREFFKKVDGGFVPKSNSEQGSAKFTDWPPFKIVAWHDYTVDRRPGSNSVLIGVGFADAEAILAQARAQFPTVMARQTKPLRFIAEDPPCA